MPIIEFENGMRVEFEGDPTPDDIDFAADQLGIVGRGDQQQKIETARQELGQAQQESEKSLSKRFAQELPRQAAKTLLQSPARFAASAALTPIDLVQGLQGQQPTTFKIPFVGETFQSEAAREQGEIIEGQRPLFHALKPFAEVPFAAAELYGLGKGLSSAAAKAKSLFENRRIAQSVRDAVTLVQPKIKQAGLEAAFTSGRLGKQKLFKGAEVAPTPFEKKMVDEIQPLIESGELGTGKSSNVLIKNAKILSEKVSRMNQGVRQMLRDEELMNSFYGEQFRIGKKGFGPDLQSYFKTAKRENRILFGGDRSVERAYDTVIDEFKTFIRSKDLPGLFEARQAFDKVIKQKYPKTFSRELEGGLAPSDNAKIQALRDVRTAVNNFISDLLPANNPYKSALRSESYLLQASKNMASKVPSTVTREGRFSSSLKSPVGKAVGTAVGTGLGIGGFETARRFFGGSD